MKRENLTKEQQDYFMLGFQCGQRKSISTVKLAAIAGMVIMFLFGMMVPVRCNAQDKKPEFDGFCHPAGSFISHKENGSYIRWIIVSPDYGFMIARDSTEVKYKGDISGISDFVKQLPKKDRRKVQDVLKDTIYLRPKDVSE